MLSKILDFEKLKKVFETYHKATGLSVALYDSDGEENLCVRNDGCVCSYVSDRSVCKNKLTYSGAKAAELKKPYIYETACGLVMCVTPVIVGGDYVGFITTGPVSLWEKDDFFEDDFILKCSQLGVDTASGGLEKLFIPHVECDAMTGLADMLMIMVDYMAEKESAQQKEKQEREKVYEKLKKDIAEKKVEGSYRKYPTALERELISYVRLGDKTNARSIINKLLSEILLYAGGDLNIIKAKLYELMAFFSRTAVEAGAETKDLSAIVKKSSKLLLDNIDFQDICYTTVEILDEYLDVVYNVHGQKPAKAHLSAAVAYINENFANSELSLKETATKVFVSPYYISHLFREEMDTTFVDYLTKVRIDHAKTLLAKGASSESVAESVGFKDVSYFIKKFKKQVGITPAKYRKQ